MQTWLYVALGGAVGSLLRYAMALGAKTLVPSLPLGTLFVNLLGSALFGVLAGAWGDEGSAVPRAVQVGILVGFLGGLTTFSSFEADTANLFRDGRIGWAFANLALQNVLGLALLFAGLKLGMAMRSGA
jgi:fluoride exporter